MCSQLCARCANARRDIVAARYKCVHDANKQQKADENSSSYGVVACQIGGSVFEYDSACGTHSIHSIHSAAHRTVFAEFLMMRSMSGIVALNFDQELSHDFSQSSLRYNLIDYSTCANASNT